MKQKNNLKKILLLMALLLSSFLIRPEIAQATHFRYGHLTWQPIAGTNNVRFTLVNAFRRAAPEYPGTYGDGYAAVGDIISEDIGGTLFFYGDGNQSTVLQYKVISIDVANNWLLAQALEPGSTTKTTIDHHYATADNGGVPWVAEINAGNRTGVELNNPNGGYRVSTLVELSSGNRSPISSLPAIVNMPYSASASFTVLASDADPNTFLTYRLALSSEAAGFGTFNQPTNLTINPITGLVSWNTLANAVVGGLYSCQVIIEDRRTSTTAPVITQVAVDFLIYISPISTPCDVNVPPAFVSPSPTCGNAFVVTEGQPLTFTVAANDANDDTITLNSAGLPSGATMTPGLPINGNPVSSVFNWTPMAGQAGAYVVTFTATDSCGAQALCSYSIQVNANTCHLHIGCKPTMPTCYGDCNGSISVTVTGGSGSYGYLWSNGATTNPIGPICAGTYTVTVTDLVTQCTLTKAIILKNKPKIGHIFTTVNATCGFCNGSLTIAGKGGNGGPYTYLWANGSTTANIAGLCPGSYTVTITDKLGCTVICTGKIVNKTRNCPQRLENVNDGNNNNKQVSVYPNPFSNTLTLNVVSDENLLVTVRDMVGRVLAEYTNVNQSIVIENQWKNGMYFITAENESRSYMEVIKVVKE